LVQVSLFVQMVRVVLPVAAGAAGLAASAGFAAGAAVGAGAVVAAACAAGAAGFAVSTGFAGSAGFAGAAAGGEEHADRMASPDKSIEPRPRRRRRENVRTDIKTLHWGDYRGVGAASSTARRQYQPLTISTGTAV
jgi:hypothetical protein